MNNQTVAVGDTVNLSTNAFTPPTGKFFVGWNTAANGSGTSYADNASITNLTTAGSTITLYAATDAGSEYPIYYY